ncbi:MAG: type IV pilus biogenesis protein PilM [Oscillospiraceae bacterium]
MLSFDITDKNVRIIKGVESNGTIKISKAANIKIDKEYIVNGSVKNVQELGLLIQKTLLMNKMSEKEAVLSISSNYTIFKELTVPKVKESDFPKQVKLEMQKAVGIDEAYAVSYIIVGNATDSQGNEIKEGNASVVTVLATACPQDLIDSYKEVFNFLDVQLKSVMIGCNCVTKLLLSDPKVKEKMPLLAVQVDENFINLNIYEDNKLTFSRFASIDPADYGNSPDYVFEAVNENVSRMLQFQKSRNPKELIDNIIFYGDTRNYDKLVAEFDDMNTSVIKVPPHIKGYENLEFSEYANAIGALFKRNKDTEKVNLLESGGTASIINDKIKSDSSFKVIMIGTLVASIVIMGGITAVVKGINAGIKSDIKAQEEYMSDPQTIADLEKYDNRNLMLENVRNYKSMAYQADNAYKSKAVLNKEAIDKIDSILAAVNEELDSAAFIDNISYKDGDFAMVIADDHADDLNELDGVPKLPALFAQKLAEDGYFAGVLYEGYQVSEESTSIKGASTVEIDEETGEEIVIEGEDAEITGQRIEFNLNVYLNGGDAELEEEVDETETETADADASATGEEGNE